jgi:tetratricopeptide (TPR) repeat protein
MNYADYVDRTQRVANLVQSGLYEEALEILNSLLSADISPIDKSMMCLNLAVVYDKMEQIDLALDWHDRGIAYERPFSRAFVSLHKAGYLATQGRVQESKELYQTLLAFTFLTESDKETIRRNIETLG